jgi:NADH dehydrogenase
MKKIVIVGAGFGGLAAALELEKQVGHREDVSIALIDKEPYHLFHANLYEVATGPEEVTSVSQLENTVAFPIAEILHGKNISFVEGKVEAINHTLRSVSVAGKTIEYDYLVSAAGSTDNFFGIPGADVYGLPLKTLTDALRIRSSVEAVVQKEANETTKRLIRFVIGGGGFSGVELAGEMMGLLRFLSWKYAFPYEKMEVMVVEGMNRLLPGLDDGVGQAVADRLRLLGVRVQVNSMVTEVTEQFINFKNGERLDYCLLVWTAGVKACTINCSEELVLDKISRVATNNTLECSSMKDVFFVGDQACVMDGSGKPMPGTAKQGLHQGRFVAHQIVRLLNGEPLAVFQPESFGYVIPVGGKWAVFKSGRWHITGRLAYVLRELWELQYFSTLVGWWKALKMVWRSDKVYARND